MWTMMHVLNTVQAHTSAQNPWELHMSRNVVYVLQSIVITPSHYNMNMMAMVLKNLWREGVITSVVTVLSGILG